MWSAALMARRWSRLLVDVIDPVMAPTPFQAGQTGEPIDDFPGWMPRPGASVIWCGAYDEVIEAYPHLANPDVAPEAHWCFDLTVEIDEAGRLAEVTLEHEDLPEAFRTMGRTDDASAAAALLGRPSEEAVPELAALLARLLMSADPSWSARS